MDVNVQVPKAGLPEHDIAQAMSPFRLTQVLPSATLSPGPSAAHASTGGGKVSSRHPLCESVRA